MYDGEKMPHSVVFLGTSAFAVPSLKALSTNEQFDVKLVITQPDRPVGRKQILTATPVKIAALELDLKVEQPEKFNSQFSILNSQFPRPDFLVVISYGQILSPEVLQWPTIAAVNVHASLLPLLRGASPIQHAILEGMNETGVTIQRMAKELDAGPILSQRILALDPRETFETLHQKLATLGAKLLTETLHSTLHEQAQNHAKATFCKKLKTEDGVIDPAMMTAPRIDRMVRALGSEPGVRWKEAKILSTSLTESIESFPLPCSEDSMLFVTKIQPTGGKPMSGKAYALGHNVVSS
ncbi:methionyl-tRNA formyltransferase [Candidatus Peribacteria bacterium]|nr:methionyl-tRNA formyltransferase [Candidatus Peribacteria bacterium]